MTKEKIYEVLKRYLKELECYKAVQFTEEQYKCIASPYDITDTLNHCKWMLETCLENLETSTSENLDKEKIMRWLGFIQGVLYSEGIFSISQLREHSRSTK